jgi:hypothetical protein
VVMLVCGEEDVVFAMVWHSSPNVFRHLSEFVLVGRGYVSCRKRWREC